ncbi:response regulator [Bradyrhizobium sp.]|uniref:response regulator n=1 Tax=Bradyrhizobium sp. TaxID=376 RepID=UPI0025C242C0|nr:response regulator [Bradyrhizobium sp.]
MPAEKVPLAGQRILIAEDESFIAFELAAMMERLGCTVVGPVSRVEEVLRHAVEGWCDGALLDVNLRGQLIFEILPRLQAVRLPLIISSGYQDINFYPMNFRMLPRIGKPVDERELRRVCELVFGNSLRDGRFDA